MAIQILFMCVCMYVCKGEEEGGRERERRDGRMERNERKRMGIMSLPISLIQIDAPCKKFIVDGRCRVSIIIITVKDE